MATNVLKNDIDFKDLPKEMQEDMEKEYRAFKKEHEEYRNKVNSRIESLGSYRPKELRDIKKEAEKIRHMLSDDNVNLSEVEKRLEDLKQKELKIIQKAEERKQICEGINSGAINAEVIGKPKGDDHNMERNYINDLMEQRAAILSTSTVLPQHTSDNIEKKFTEVSGILDLVTKMNLSSGSSLKIPYNTENVIGGITEEGKDYTETQPQFDDAEINGIKITAYTQYSEEVEKLPQADYQGFIEQEIRKSIQKKIIEQIVNGNGVRQFSGIYNTNVVGEDADITVAAIDKDTLNTIVYGHNTEAEDVEGNLVLLLNKKDLGEFAKVQANDGTPVYNITFGDTGMTGYINGTKFCICNSLKPFSTATSGDYTMAYIDPSKYMLASFSQIELRRDYSTGFKQGLVSVRGSVIIGGSMVNPFGLSRVKKA